MLHLGFNDLRASSQFEAAPNSKRAWNPRENIMKGTNTQSPTLAPTLLVDVQRYVPEVDVRVVWSCGYRINLVSLRCNCTACQDIPLEFLTGVSGDIVV